MTDEAKALVERLRWGAWYYEDPFDGKAYASDDPLEAADLIETQARENERLREALREVFEEWAGSEGFIPETAPEGYLLQLTKRMADIARAALGNFDMTKPLTPLRRKDQATGYQAAVRDIVAWLRKDDFILTADELEKKFGKAND